MTTGGQIVIDALKAAGVSTVFLVPGGQTLAILDAAFGDPDIDLVAMRHEMAAVHAADAHFRITGEPGVCLVTTGPGAGNTLSALGGAFRDRDGLVLLTCNNPREYLDEEDAQAADHVAMLSPLTKWSVQVRDARALTRTLRTALSMAANSPAGPVHVDLPRDVVASPIPSDAPRPVAGEGRYVAPPMAPSEVQLDAAATLLASAARPVFWVGDGVRQAGAVPALLSLAERLEAPVVTTFTGMATAPTAHPLAFGPLTRHGTHLSKSVLSQADLVLAIGMRLSSSSTHHWSIELPTLIHSDADPSALGRHYLPDVALPGDAALVLDGLSKRLDSVNAPDSRRGWLDALGAERVAWRADAAALATTTAAGRIHPATVIDEVSRLAPPETVFAVDAGNPGIWSHLLEFAAGQTYMKPVDFGQMGFALPAAIGAKRARPQRPVIALIGDGALGMTVAEIETAVRETLPIAIVVFNDAAYNNIRQEQLHDTGAPRYIGVDFTDVDFARVAQGFGALGRTARNTTELREALRDALAQSEQPTLIDAKIDPAPNVWEHLF